MDFQITSFLQGLSGPSYSEPTSWSPFNSLPVELCSSIISHSSHLDLISLSLSSRHLRCLAVPFLFSRFSLLTYRPAFSRDYGIKNILRRFISDWPEAVQGAVQTLVVDFEGIDAGELDGECAQLLSEALEWIWTIKGGFIQNLEIRLVQVNQRPGEEDQVSQSSLFNQFVLPAFLESFRRKIPNSNVPRKLGKLSLNLNFFTDQRFESDLIETFLRTLLETSPSSLGALRLVSKVEISNAVLEILESMEGLSELEILDSAILSKGKRVKKSDRVKGEQMKMVTGQEEEAVQIWPRQISHLRVGGSGKFFGTLIDCFKLFSLLESSSQSLVLAEFKNFSLPTSLSPSLVKRQESCNLRFPKLKIVSFEEVSFGNPKNLVWMVGMFKDSEVQVLRLRSSPAWSWSYYIPDEAGSTSKSEHNTAQSSQPRRNPTIPRSGVSRNLFVSILQDRESGRGWKELRRLEVTKSLWFECLSRNVELWKSLTKEGIDVKVVKDSEISYF